MVVQNFIVFLHLKSKTTRLLLLYYITMDIRKSYEEIAKQIGRLPNYANCTIAFLDTPDSPMDVVIKLSSDVDPDEDDEIFFYTDGIDDFISLTQEGVEDFIVRADYPINFY